MPAKPVLDMVREAAPTVSVGMLTADLLALGSELKTIERAGVRLLHVDVMDGCFCPAMTFGPPLVKAMKTSMLKDVHLMIRDPLDKAEAYVSAGADMVTFAIEGAPHPHRVLQALGGMANANDAGRGILRGVSLNPGTPLEVVEPLLDELEMVLLLAVNPGWGGQKFIPATARRIEQVRRMLVAADSEALVMIDGGVTRSNIAEVARMEADLIVAGSAVFDGQDAAANARFLIETVAAART